MRPNTLAFLVFAAIVLSSCGGGAGTMPTVQAPIRDPGSSAIPNRYSVTDLGTVLDGVPIGPTSVNDSGEVVGGALSVFVRGCPKFCVDGHGWVFSNGSLRALPVPDAYQTVSAYDVNDTATIVGSASRLNGQSMTALLWKPDGTIVNLGMGIPVAGLQPAVAEAYGISDTGTIAGRDGAPAYGEFAPVVFDGRGGAYNPCGQLNGFMVQGDVVAANNVGLIAGNSETGAVHEMITCPPFTPISPPGNPAYNPYNFNRLHDINDAGDVVGWYDTAAPRPPIFHAFLNHDGVSADIGTLFPGKTSAQSYAFALNDAGVVVGFSDEAESAGLPVNPRAFVYANGKMVDLNTLLPPECATWTVVEATSISGNGKIAAVVFVGGYPHGTQHAVLLTPVQ